MAARSASEADVGALLRAVREGDTVAMRDLLDEGVDVNVNWGEPLRTAVEAGNRNSVRFLVKAGANVSGYHTRACTPLDLAVEKNDTATVNLLIEHGALTNGLWTNRGILYRAVAHDNLPVVQMLLKAGAPVAMPCNTQSGQLSGSQCAIFAARSREAILLLVQHGANVNARDVPMRRTPFLHRLEYATAPKQMYDALKTLLACGADATATCAQGYTAAHYVAKRIGWHPLLFDLLWEAGVNFNVAANDGTTPMALAAEPTRTQLSRYALKRRIP